MIQTTHWQLWHGSVSRIFLIRVLMYFEYEPVNIVTCFNRALQDVIILTMILFEYSKYLKQFRIQKQSFKACLKQYTQLNLNGMMPLKDILYLWRQQCPTNKSLRQKHKKNSLYFDHSWARTFKLVESHCELFRTEWFLFKCWVRYLSTLNWKQLCIQNIIPNFAEVLQKKHETGKCWTSMILSNSFLILKRFPHKTLSLLLFSLN